MANLPDRRSSSPKSPRGQKLANESKAQMLLALDVLQKHQHRYFQLAQARQPKVENSLLLRAMVQLMVSISILAIDLATNAHQSYIWISVAAIAGTGSWLLRHHRRHPAVIGGSMAWLLLMCWIFQSLGQQSVMPTGILPNLAMGILATMPIVWTIRQNLGFAIFLSWCTTAIVSTINTNPLTIGLMLLISLIALPTLWLEYRSRLELPPLPWNWAARQLVPIPWRHLAQIGAVTILAGLVLATFLGTMPQIKLPELTNLANHSTVNSLAERAREFENSYGSNSEEDSTIAMAAADSPPSDRHQHGHEYAQNIETKYEQLSPDRQAQLQAQTQEIIQYQRHLDGKTADGSTTEQAEALATFLQNHSQPDNPSTASAASLPENPIDSLLTSCANPQSCQIPGSSNRLHETYQLMARSVDIPPPVAKAQEARKLAPGQLDIGNRSANPASNLSDPNTPTPSPQKPNHLNLVGLVVLLLIGVAIGCCWLWMRNEQQRQAYRRRFASLPPLEQIYRQMLKQLQQQGVVTKRAAQSPAEYAAVVHSQLPPTSARLVYRLSQTYTAWRYGHKPANVDLMQQLLQELMADLHPKKS